MEFKDYPGNIYDILYKEWNWKQIPTWKSFIDSKNLGIEFMSKTGPWPLVHIYKIVDKKKWLLTKLKYGF